MNTDQIWKDFHDQLLGFIITKVKDKDLAHDLLQEVFIKIHLNIHTLKSGANLSGWIYAITKNVIIDHYRKTKSEQKMEWDIQTMADTSEEHEEAEYCEECLKPFVNELPENYKEAILATDLGPYSQKEYAKEIGISYSGLKSRVQRGRAQLFHHFKNCCQHREKVTTSNVGKLSCGCPA